MPDRVRGSVRLFVLVTMLATFPFLAVSTAVSSERPVDFALQIRPLLSKNCFACHGPAEEDRQGGLRLDERDSALGELDSGLIAIVPGKPDESELFQRLTTDDESMRMPPADSGHELKPEEIALIQRWIEEGAKYSEHWSFVKPQRPALPEVKDASWPKNEIDYFILSKLEAEGLTPAPEADRYAIIRRLSFDLRGIPPSLDEVDAFVNDRSPEAYERLVDRFLADPAYGERWARLWLDLARYADSMGYGSDPLRTIWRYRDWTIDAFNSNMPFDQFTIEQLAGDMLPDPSQKQLMATAFHRNTMTNVEGGTDDEEFRVAAVMDRVNTTFQVWMGLTYGCAQCHDHKFDPISHKEYYEAFAFFNQTADADLATEAPFIEAPTPAMRAQIQAVESQIAKLWTKADTPELAAAQEKWLAQYEEPAEWATIEPIEAKAASGVEVSFNQKDSSFFIPYGVISPETYTITAQPGLKRLTAIRLEALPRDDLPGAGSGRGADGNFILTEFRAKLTPDVTNFRPARYVRIELPGEKKILSLAEVEVRSGEENIALAGKATQSSTYLGNEAKAAIDGNTSGDLNEGGTTHTQNEDDPWWELELASETVVDDVAVWNRTDGGLGDRLVGARVILLDASRRPIWRRTLHVAPSPSQALPVTGPQEVVFSGAKADYSAPANPVLQSIKVKGVKPNGGWGISPEQEKPHAAVFFLEEPIDASGDAMLTIELDHQFAFFGFALGSFRLSVTDSEVAASRGDLPPDVSEALDTPADQRTTKQLARLKSHFRSIAPELEALRKEIAEVEKTKPKPPTLPVMRELAEDKKRTTHLLVKGSFLNPGEEVQSLLPTSFHDAETEAAGDRLDLARWLVDRDNPLTARVTVNRYWSQFFGMAFVPTQGDFGSQGDLPSHPELLDWLAVEFMANGWDMKQLLRTIVTSAAYRQSSDVTPEKLERDPDNRLVSRGPRFRLEAEMVRDQALAVSGLLSRKMHGPSVYPPQPPNMWQAAFNAGDNWNTSTGEDRYRRGIYTFWRRTVPYPSMATFDAPSRELCTVKRSRTNTPLQAFVTLNDPAFVEAAQALGRRMMTEGGATAEERAAFGFRLCVASPPDAEQTKALVRLYNDELEHFRKEAESAAKLATDPLGPLPAGLDAAEAAAWTVVANVLLNMDAVLTKG